MVAAEQPTLSASASPGQVKFRWRGWWDFGTGALGDIGCHAMDPVFRALKLGQPISVEASSSRVNKETYPLASMITYQFPARGEMPPAKLVWYDGGLRPPRPADLADGQVMGDNGRMLVGEKGIILGNRIITEARRKEYQEPTRTLPRSPGHYREWIDACKGSRKTSCNFDYNGMMNEQQMLGLAAYRAGGKLQYDGFTGRVTNNEKATELLRRAYRARWTLHG